jgi:hypothetical protein
MQKQSSTHRFERFTGPYSYIVVARRIEGAAPNGHYVASVTEMVQYPHAGATGITVTNKPNGEYYGETPDQAADRMIADVERWIRVQTGRARS